MVYGVVAISGAVGWGGWGGWGGGGGGVLVVALVWCGRAADA